MKKKNISISYNHASDDISEAILVNGEEIYSSKLFLAEPSEEAHDVIRKVQRLDGSISVSELAKRLIDVDLDGVEYAKFCCSIGFFFAAGSKGQREDIKKGMEQDCSISEFVEAVEKGTYKSVCEKEPDFPYKRTLTRVITLMILGGIACVKVKRSVDTAKDILKEILSDEKESKKEEKIDKDFKANLKDINYN
jgi:hypothetical protein